MTRWEYFKPCLPFISDYLDSFQRTSSVLYLGNTNVLIWKCIMGFQEHINFFHVHGINSCTTMLGFYVDVLVEKILTIML